MAKITRTQELASLGLNADGQNRITVTTSAYNYKLSESIHSNYVDVNVGVCEFDPMENGTCKVVGRGNMGGTDIVIPEYWGEAKVTEIANDAFAGDTTLTSITIPETVIVIGKRAFKGCSNLSSVEIKDDSRKIVYVEKHEDWEGAFYVRYTTTDGETNGGGELVDFVENAPYTGIAMYACAVPANTNRISFYTEDGQYETNEFIVGPEELSNCLFKIGKNLIAPNLYYYPYIDGTYNSTYVSKFGGLTISEEAFADCHGIDKNNNKTGLKSITIPQRTVTLANSAFARCEALTTVSIPSSHRLSTIGAYAFKNCYDLTSVYLSPGIKSIGAEAFKGCQLLSICELPSGLQFIESGAFEGCNTLSSVYIPSTVTKIGSKAFGQDLFGGYVDGKKGKSIRFENAYTWIMTPGITVPSDAKDVTLWNPTDLYCLEETGAKAYLNGERLAYDYADKYWHRLERMLPPQIGVEDGILSMTDPLGIAESFHIYVNDKRRATVYVSTTPYDPHE